MNLLDELQLKSGEVLYGIADFVTAKHIYWFDFTKPETPDYILLAASWKMSDKNTRFSIWSVLEFPGIALPRVVLIPRSNVLKSSTSIKATPRSAQKKTQLKL